MEKKTRRPREERKKKESKDDYVVLIYFTVKAKLSLCLTKYHAMKSYRGLKGNVIPRIINHTALPPGKEPLVPIG
jgi:hypothetical protein